MTIDAKTRSIGSNHRSVGSFTFALIISATALLTLLIVLAPATALAAGSALTGPATKVHRTTAVLNGHLDPEGDPGVVECSFEWGATLAYGNTAPCAEGDAFSASADVSAVLAGLSAGTTYHFRLNIETTSNGPFSGADQSFTTRLAPSEHPQIASFGKDGTSASSFGGFYEHPSPTLNLATRKLYVGVTSPANGTSGHLYGLDASSSPAFSPLAEFPPLATQGITNSLHVPIAVDNTGLGTAGNIYFTTHEFVEAQQPWNIQLNGLNSSGGVLPGFPIDPRVNPGPPVYDDPSGDRELSSVAVNSDGEIWTFARGQIFKYSPTGTFLGVLATPFMPLASGAYLAFDTNDDLYVASTSSIWKLTATSGYAAIAELPSPPPSTTVAGIAVDPSTHYLYVNAPGSQSGLGVSVYAPSGELFDEFAPGAEGSGIAVDAANHHVYVGALSSKLAVYGLGAELSPPTPTNGPASAITAATATLNGFVDPEGLPVTECKFEYGGPAYEKAIPCSSSPGSGSGDIAVSADLTGLQPDSTYHFRLAAANASSSAKGLRDATFTTPSRPTVGSPAVANLSHNAAELKALVDPKGYATAYRFEYGTTTAYGTKVPVPDGNAGAGTGDVPVSVHLAGLQPDTIYHWRIVAESINGTATLSDASFTTFGPAKAEAMGSPIRTTTTALLQGRVDPDGAATTYRFEYGDQGPCDANPCTVLPDRSAGSGTVFEFVAESIEGLEPNTTYHYRVIAESAIPGSPSISGDMSVTTRSSDAALSHGRFPGPPGSDRAYEQVSLPDTGGNPVARAYALSDNGDRAFYRVSGGTPISGTGTAQSALYAERVETAPHVGSWHSQDIGPPRAKLVGNAWLEPAGKRDLSDQVMLNIDTATYAAAIWRLRPGQPAVEIFEPQNEGGVGVSVSQDSSRVLLQGSKLVDPAHPTPSGSSNVYDVSSGTPRITGLMPDGSVSPCGSTLLRRNISADGSIAFFQSCTDLYMREIDAEQTKLVAKNSNLIKLTPGAAFLVTGQSLDPGDTGGDDVYRYDVGDGALQCVTCVVPVAGLNANVVGISVAVAGDGSRVYFESSAALLPGAAAPGIYRVTVADGDLAYLAPGEGIQLGEDVGSGQAITPDGSALIFTSNDPHLNSLGGQQNGGTLQYYRYDDDDRSLTCLSCPQDGSAPFTAVPSSLLAPGGADEGVGANKTAISADGRTFAFATMTSLLGADQNTARAGQKPQVGTDVYEWRDGRLLLITDGLIDWPVESPPEVSGITPSGNDILFVAATQYTQDAIDGYSRLYDARIGGGFEVPPAPKPCPLEVCQGTPKGAPEEQAPGTGTFAGPGNGQQRAHHKKKQKKQHKKKSRRKKSQHKKQSRQQAKHDRRTAR